MQFDRDSCKCMRCVEGCVVALDMVTSGADFRTTSRVLVNDHGMDVNEAFFLVTRAFAVGALRKTFFTCAAAAPTPVHHPGL